MGGVTLLGMATLSLDLRERILSSYDAKEGTREDIAIRYRVSLGMVKKLLSQRKKIGDISPQHHLAGRKPIINEAHRRTLQQLLKQDPGLTLEELRDQLNLPCTIQAVHYVLHDMGITYKKRHFERANKIAPTSKKPGKNG